MGRAVAVVAGVFALLVGVAALVVTLSGGDEDADVTRLVSDSVDLARQAGTVRATFSFTLDAPPGFEDQALSFGGDGAFDFASGRSRMVIRLTPALGGDGASATVPEEVEMELVTDQFTTYVRLPELTQAVGSGPEWFLLDLAALARVTGRDSVGLGASDPAQALEYLRGAAMQLDEVGQEAVAGVDTTHYVVSVDLERAVSVTPESQKEEVREAVEQFQHQFGTSRFPVDVWLDADGLPRRLRYELDLSEYDDSGEVPQGAIMSFTMELFAYGHPVEITVPPTDQVGDLAAVIERVGSAAPSGSWSEGRA